jgi:hypothetical protein
MFLGADGSDSLSGADGSDFLIGGAGADTYSGGHGDDFFSIDASDAWTDIMGGKGLAVGDTVVVDGSDAYYFGNLFQQGIESYFGGGGADTVYASVTNDDFGPRRATIASTAGPATIIFTAAPATISTSGASVAETTGSPTGIMARRRATSFRWARGSPPPT